MFDVVDPAFSRPCIAVRNRVPKWFTVVVMIRLAANQDWLHKATKEISN